MTLSSYNVIVPNSSGKRDQSTSRKKVLSKRRFIGGSELNDGKTEISEEAKDGRKKSDARSEIYVNQYP